MDAGEPGSDTVVWAHPIDAHYLSGALQVRVWNGGRGSGGGGSAGGGRAGRRPSPSTQSLRASFQPPPFTLTPLHAHHPLQGWPRLLLQAWRLDDLGRLEVEGYGFVHIPSAPGLHELSVPLWRPLGTPAQELSAYFVGGAVALHTTSVLFSAASERYRLVTAPSGTVHLRLEVLQRFVDAEA